MNNFLTFQQKNVFDALFILKNYSLFYLKFKFQWASCFYLLATFIRWGLPPIHWSTPQDHLLLPLWSHPRPKAKQLQGG